MAKKHELRVPAIEIRQGRRRRLYSFAVDGKSLPEFSTISRIQRQAEDGIRGYQRPEVISHIAEIRTYLESEAPLIPNAIVIAFDKRVRFEPVESNGVNVDYSRPGVLVIPLDAKDDAEKPGWIVDGQQRAAAIRTARIKSFPICVVAFIAESDAEQREQFILVNATKPLPKGLIYELLPTTEAKLPSLLQRRRFPAKLAERLNHDDDSPFHRLIRTPTNPKGLVADNSILKMLENSLSDGALYRFRDDRTAVAPIEEMLDVVKEYWWAVKAVFPTAWGQPPRKSRLMHGAGIIGMGFVMDTIADRHRRAGRLSRKQFADDLRPLVDSCRWTQGHWEFGAGNIRKWSEIQNVPRDIQLLANYLLVQYKALVWNQRVG